MEGLRRRRDFLRAATGFKAPTAGFILQAISREADGPPRVGYTVSRKVGSAVERNRVRRRLREIVRHSATGMRPGYDYVLVGRRSALTERFDRMLADFGGALRRVHTPRPSRGAGAGRRAGTSDAGAQRDSDD